MSGRGPLGERSVLAMSDYSLVTALGQGRAQTVSALRENRSALAPCTFDTLPIPTYVGEISGLDECPLQGKFSGFDCRNNRLAAMALAQDGFCESVAARARALWRRPHRRLSSAPAHRGSCRPKTPIAGAIRRPGRCPRDFDYARTHNTYSLARFVRMLLDLAGPAFVVSAACAATAKVFANAARMIAAGFAMPPSSAAPTACARPRSTAFIRLVCMAEQPCRPFDAARNGISIGEAAGFALLEKPGRCSAIRRDPAPRRRREQPMPIICRRRIPKASARGWRWSARWRPPALEPANRLRQSARHGDLGRRRRRGLARSSICSAPRRHAVRPRVSPGTRWARRASSRR